MKAKEPWKYVKPRDLTTPVTINDKKWGFYTKYKCRATGRVGLYQLSHTDDTHDPNWRPEGNTLPAIADPDPTPAPPHCLRFDTPPDDDLVFIGINFAPVFPSSAQPHDEREDYITQETRRDVTGKSYVHIQSPTVPVPVHSTSMFPHGWNVPDHSTSMHTHSWNEEVVWCLCWHLLWVYKHSVLALVATDVMYQSRVWFSICMSICQCILQYLTIESTEHNSSMARISHGFPAKLMILTTVMFFTAFLQGYFFNPSVSYDYLTTTIIIQYLSIYTSVRHLHGTGNLLQDYNQCRVEARKELLNDSGCSHQPTSNVNTTSAKSTMA